MILLVESKYLLNNIDFDIIKFSRRVYLLEEVISWRMFLFIGWYFYVKMVIIFCFF